MQNNQKDLSKSWSSMIFTQYKRLGISVMIFLLTAFISELFFTDPTVKLICVSLASVPFIATLLIMIVEAVKYEVNAFKKQNSK